MTLELMNCAISRLQTIHEQFIGLILPVYFSIFRVSSIKPLQNSADSSALDLVISQVGSSDVNVSIQALSEVRFHQCDDHYTITSLFYHTA